MRTDLELLQILKTFLEEKGMDGCSGLCFVINHLEDNLLIDHNEWDRMMSIIEENQPGFPFRGGWYFPKWELPPRLKFVNELIEKYENESISSLRRKPVRM